MKKQRITVITAKLLAALMLAAVVFGSVSMEARAEQTGTVTVDNAKVRSDASTDSSVVSTLANGTTISVNGEKTDSSGNVWYQVTLSDGKTGYVRSDLMNVTETADAADTAADANAGAAEGALEDGVANTSVVAGGVDVTAISNPEGVTPQDLQSAKINTNGKVRSDASTNDDIVAQLSQGTEMVISGSKLGSDSKTWYYVTFIDGGATKNGYIRSDLVDIGEVIIMPTAQPEEPVETPEEEQPVVEEVNNDYELVYTDDGTGNNVWWLYNHVDNTREKLQELLDFADSQASKTATLTSTNQKLKLICIVLGALLAIAVIAVIVMAVKLASGG
ncbi:MAG: SH3 domain-containing protein, partial [Lachnospiraceae bacterium]|nr:SH3 domain-containing protein [Lachnospiraceae bacterium]